MKSQICKLINQYSEHDTITANWYWQHKACALRSAELIISDSREGIQVWNTAPEVKVQRSINGHHDSRGSKQHLYCCFSYQYQSVNNSVKLEKTTQDVMMWLHLI